MKELYNFLSDIDRRGILSIMYNFDNTVANFRVHLMYQGNSNTKQHDYNLEEIEKGISGIL